MHRPMKTCVGFQGMAPAGGCSGVEGSPDTPGLQV